ncbi:hypothetical protein ACI6PS_11605 [Flavobacterium sp. PLA-1-15]|uniref:hypothetical protein n=1 Tax=Flavobacterium sp. PLA-1-15 TaxID=3380533 RepID=UPI003B7A8EBF
MRKYFILTAFILLSLSSFSQNNNDNKKQNTDKEPSGIGSGHGAGGKGGNSFIEPYSLTGRKVISELYPENNCNEYGTVVMEIVVNRKGNVLEANPGRGSTNLSECLVKVSKEAALKTKWSVDKNAPEKHIGRIVYKFKMK